MYLVIAEKPSVSRAIAEVIGAQEREDGYLQGTDCMVSWCFGHLAEYVSPDAYDEKFNQWRYEDLPIIPKNWKVTVSEDKKDQFYILKRLLNSPEIEYVVNACDTLLIDVVTHSVTGVTNELSEMIEKLPKEKQQRIINAVRALVE